MENSWQSKPLGQIIIARFKQWWNAPLTYPWSDELNDEVNGENSAVLCHRCFTPQEHPGWFCPECGAATGPYNNVLPYIRIFSVGEVFRNGVACKLKRKTFVTGGYLLASFFEYVILFPFYWYRFFKNRPMQSPGCETEDRTEGGGVS